MIGYLIEHANVVMAIEVKLGHVGTGLKTPDRTFRLGTPPTWDLTRAVADPMPKRLAQLADGRVEVRPVGDDDPPDEDFEPASVLPAVVLSMERLRALTRLRTQRCAGVLAKDIAELLRPAVTQRLEMAVTDPIPERTSRQATPDDGWPRWAGHLPPPLHCWLRDVLGIEQMACTSPASFVSGVFPHPPSFLADAVPMSMQGERRLRGFPDVAIDCPAAPTWRREPWDHNTVVAIGGGSPELATAVLAKAVATALSRKRVLLFTEVMPGHVARPGQRATAHTAGKPARTASTTMPRDKQLYPDLTDIADTRVRCHRVLRVPANSLPNWRASGRWTSEGEAGTGTVHGPSDMDRPDASRSGLAAEYSNKGPVEAYLIVEHRDEAAALGCVDSDALHRLRLVVGGVCLPLHPNASSASDVVWGAPAARRAEGHGGLGARGPVANPLLQPRRLGWRSLRPPPQDPATWGPWDLDPLHPWHRLAFQPTRATGGAATTTTSICSELMGEDAAGDNARGAHTVARRHDRIIDGIVPTALPKGLELIAGVERGLAARAASSDIVAARMRATYAAEVLRGAAMATYLDRQGVRGTHTASTFSRPRDLSGCMQCERMVTKRWRVVAPLQGAGRLTARRREVAVEAATAKAILADLWTQGEMPWARRRRDEITSEMRSRGAALCGECAAPATAEVWSQRSVARGDGPLSDHDAAALEQRALAGGLAASAFNDYGSTDPGWMVASPNELVGEWIHHRDTRNILR